MLSHLNGAIDWYKKPWLKEGGVGLCTTSSKQMQAQSDPQEKGSKMHGNIKNEENFDKLAFAS